MYCVSCGLFIQDESKFCSNCGTKQFGEVNFLKLILNRLGAVGKRERPDDTLKSLGLFERILRKASGWYLVWILIQLGLLLIKGNSVFAEGKRSRYFWPIDEFSILADYDIREFIVYTVFPVVIFYTWNRIDPDFIATRKMLKRKRRN